MAVRGRKAHTNNSERVEEWFKKNPNVTASMSMLKIDLGLTGLEILNALSYLRSKATRGEAITIRIEERGKHWRYTPRRNASGEPIPEKRVRTLRDVPAKSDLPNPFARSQAAGRALNNPAPEVTKRVKGTRPSNGLPFEPALPQNLLGTGNPPDWAQVEQEFMSGMHPHQLADEPLATFKIVGTLTDNSTVLKGVSSGVEGVWVARLI